MTGHNIWVYEEQTENMRLGLRVKKVLESLESKFQRIEVVETYQYGKMLILDGLYQTCDKWEFFYHEMLVHVPMFAHPNPKDVLIIGGGDGGSLKNVLKHPKVHVDLVEIDKKVIEISKKYFDFPQTGNFSIFLENGLEYLKRTDKKYDIIIVDGSDPIGPAQDLFKHEFFHLSYEKLRDDGMFVTQSGSPIIGDYHEYFFDTFKKLKQIFPIVLPYFTVVPIYPTGYWSFIIASKGPDPRTPKRKALKEMDLKYYNEEVHRASFAIPNFLLKRMQGELL